MSIPSHYFKSGHTPAWLNRRKFLTTVIAALLEVGFTPDEIAKIGGGNYCRVFDAATAGHA